MPNAYCGSFLLWKELVTTCKMKYLQGNSNPNRSIIGEKHDTHQVESKRS